MSRSIRRRMSMSRRLLNTHSRRGTLGALAPFTDITLSLAQGASMPKPSLKAAVVAAPQVVTTTAPKVLTLLEQRNEVAAKLDQLTAKKKALDAELLAEVRKRAGEKGKLDTPDFTALHIHAENVQISATKLASLGVKASVIEAAKARVPYDYVLVTRKKPAVSLEEALGK